jgi:phage terminase Nu1 subunit (DNA packaging protein)
MSDELSAEKLAEFKAAHDNVVAQLRATIPWDKDKALLEMVELLNLGGAEIARLQRDLAASREREAGLEERCARMAGALDEIAHDDAAVSELFAAVKGRVAEEIATSNVLSWAQSIALTALAREPAESKRLRAIVQAAEVLAREINDVLATATSFDIRDKTMVRLLGISDKYAKAVRSKGE